MDFLFFFKSPWKILEILSNLSTKNNIYDLKKKSNMNLHYI